MKVQKWENSFAEQLNISDGSEVAMVIKDHELTISPKKETLGDLLSQVTMENKHQEVDFGMAEGREL